MSMFIAFPNVQRANVQVNFPVLRANIQVRCRLPVQWANVHVHGPCPLY